jgi:hypothetical protein
MMHHTQFEKNWSRGYQEEIKNIQMLTDTVHHVWPWGQNLYPEDNEIHNFGRSLPALHHHAFSFSYIHVVSEKNIFYQLVNFDTFCPAPKPKGVRKPEIHNLCPPCPNNASNQI